MSIFNQIFDAWEQFCVNKILKGPYFWLPDRFNCFYYLIVISKWNGERCTQHNECKRASPKKVSSLFFHTASHLNKQFVVVSSPNIIYINECFISIKTDLGWVIFTLNAFFSYWWRKKKLFRLSRKYFVSLLSSNLMFNEWILFFFLKGCFFASAAIVVIKKGKCFARPNLQGQNCTSEKNANHFLKCCKNPVEKTTFSSFERASEKACSQDPQGFSSSQKTKKNPTILWHLNIQWIEIIRQLFVLSYRFFFCLSYWDGLDNFQGWQHEVDRLAAFQHEKMKQSLKIRSRTH